MFLYTSSGKFNGRSAYKFAFHNLAEAENDKWLEQAARWANHKWGYLRHFPDNNEKGFHYYLDKIRRMQKDFYIVTYGEKFPQPVGMFSLTDNNVDIDKTKKTVKTKELDFVYVEESFRGLGVGGLLIEKAKALALEQKFEMIILDTLNPYYLNRFYQNKNAKIICDNIIARDEKSAGFPTTLLNITDLSPKKRKI